MLQDRVDYTYLAESMGLALETFEKLETKEGILRAIRDTFRVFSSLLRIGSAQGMSPMRMLFPAEFDSELLQESSIMSDCKLYAHRATGEKNHLQHKGKFLEIGVAGGCHAASLIKNLNPSTFDGVDLVLGSVKEENRIVFKNHESKGNKIEFHQVDSVKFLEEKITEKANYDMIYIDANHWYEFVKKELELSSRLVGIGGHIILNDYVMWFVNSMEPCGVIRATNNFLQENRNWRVEYFAINDRDICIRRIS